jgi:hypothetical protein
MKGALKQCFCFGNNTIYQFHHLLLLLLVQYEVYVFFIAARKFDADDFFGGQPLQNGWRCGRIFKSDVQQSLVTVQSCAWLKRGSKNNKIKMCFIA